MEVSYYNCLGPYRERTCVCMFVSIFASTEFTYACSSLWSRSAHKRIESTQITFQLPPSARVARFSQSRLVFQPASFAATAKRHRSSVAHILQQYLRKVPEPWSAAGRRLAD